MNNALREGEVLSQIRAINKLNPDKAINAICGRLKVILKKEEEKKGKKKTSLFSRTFF